MPSKVLIIGAGLGGLTLAQGLKKAGIPFHIFEQDTSSGFRAQGYRLRINGDGATALRQTLPSEIWAKFEQSCAVMKFGGTNLDALTGEALQAHRMMPRNPTSMPFTADRTVMRSVLLEGLDEHVSFGKRLERYSFSADCIVAHFHDGSVVEGLLLVGADGVRSRVRRNFLPQLKFLDTYGRLIFGKTTLTDDNTAKLANLPIGAMSLLRDHPHTRPMMLLLEAVRFAENDLRPQLPPDYVYWVMVSDKEDLGVADEEFFHMPAEQAADLSLKLTKNWNKSFIPLLELQDRSQTAGLRVSTAPTHLPAWETSPHITLLGDAIHVMPPTGGVGANTALQDAASLVKELQRGITVESIARYEAEMRTRAEKAIADSSTGARFMFQMRPAEELKELTF